MATSRFLWKRSAEFGEDLMRWVSILNMVVSAGMVMESRVGVANRGGKGLADGEGGQHQGLH